MPGRHSALVYSEQSIKPRRPQRTPTKQTDSQNLNTTSSASSKLVQRRNRREERTASLHRPHKKEEHNQTYLPNQATAHSGPSEPPHVHRSCGICIKACTWDLISAAQAAIQNTMSRHDVGSLQGIWKRSRSSSMLVGLAELVRRQRLGSDQIWRLEMLNTTRLSTVPPKRREGELCPHAGVCDRYVGDMRAWGYFEKCR